MVNRNFDNFLEMSSQEYEMIPIESTAESYFMNFRSANIFGTRILGPGGGFQNSVLQPGTFQPGGYPTGVDTPLDPLDTGISDLLVGPLGLEELQNYFNSNKMQNGYDIPSDEAPQSKKKKREVDYGDIKNIAVKIHKYNPGVFKSLMKYGIPYYEARNIIMKIVRLTLLYGEMDREDE